LYFTKHYKLFDDAQLLQFDGADTTISTQENDIHRAHRPRCYIQFLGLINLTLSQTH